jgi:hypothetical protein
MSKATKGSVVKMARAEARTAVRLGVPAKVAGDKLVRLHGLKATQARELRDYLREMTTADKARK